MSLAIEARPIAVRLARRLGPRPGPIRARRVWAFAAWLGLVFGLVESLVDLTWRHLGPASGDPDLWANWHRPWMAPVGLACWAVALALPMGLARRIAPRAVSRLLPVLLVGLGTLSALGPIRGLHPWAAAVLSLGLAVRLGPRLRLDRPDLPRIVRRSLPPLAAVWLVLVVACGLVPALREPLALANGPTPRPGAPNVLLVVLDTVRADHLGLGGSARPTSPRLDRRAAGGVTFGQARATTPYTLGTHASLFTGHWMSETSARVDTPLDDALPTLAEHLRDQGYSTAGFVGNIFYGSARYGLDRGFLHYHDVPGNITRRVTPREILRAPCLGDWLIAWLERKWRILAPLQRQRLDASTLNREALDWLDQTRPPDRPFFLFLNEFDAHAPYTLPPEAPQPFARLAPHLLEARLERLEADNVSTADRAVTHAHARDAYDDGIAWIDRNLDRLLGSLDQRGLLENTLVIVTADHGEMLGEHGLFGHGQTLRRPVVHVPLVVLGGRGMGVPAGVRVDRPVSLRDVPATVLDLIGDPDADRFPGRSLARFWTPDAPEQPDDALVLSEVQHMPWERHTPAFPSAFGPIWLVTSGRWSYHRQEHETRGRMEHLFDLDADLGEAHDLARDPAHAETLRTLRARLDQALDASAEPRPQEPPRTIR